MWTDANVMGALPNIGGALCSTPQSLADPAAGMSCSNAANIGERKIWTQSEFCIWPKNSVKGQQPQKYIYMVHQPRRRPNIMQSLGPPFPEIDITGTVVIVWRARGKIIRSVLCSIVCNNCTE